MTSLMMVERRPELQECIDDEKCIERLTVVLLLAVMLIMTSGICRAHEALTDEEQAYISRNPEITIAMDTSWIPYAFKEDDGREVGGIISKILDAVAANVGLTVTYISNDSYIDAITSAKAGGAMLISGIANDPEMARKNDVWTTDPYIQIYYSAVTRSNLTDLYAPGADYKIAVCTGSYSTMAMEKVMPSYEFVEYHSNEECMKAVRNGEVDVALVATTAVEYYSNQHEYSALNSVIVNDFTWGLSFGVTKNCDPLLISILNKGIAQLTENDIAQATYSGLIDAVQENHTVIDWIYEEPVLAGSLAVAIAVVLSALVFVVIAQHNRARHLATLGEALKKAEEANNARMEFLSRMSHDMRTPMNGILGMVALSETENDPAELKASMGKIGQSGQYLLGLINDTLDFQRIESGKMMISPEPTNVTDIITNITDMVMETAREKNIELRVTSTGTTADDYILVDKMRIKQIFVNLLSNAIKYTTGGGTVEFTVNMENRDEQRAVLNITVSDTGVGMSEDFLKNGIFKPFSQETNILTATYAGSGLGLSIAKQLVEIMGGTITVESELGAGSRFDVTLNVQRVDGTALRQGDKTTADRQNMIHAALNGKRVLLAEDHPLNAEIAQRLLEKTGVSVEWAHNGSQAVDMFRAHPEKYYDAILMDIRMPEMDGFAAAKAIRSCGMAYAPAVPIIAMTANVYQEDAEQAIASGMNAHISKPVDPALMYETLANYMTT